MPKILGMQMPALSPTYPQSLHVASVLGGTLYEYLQQRNDQLLEEDEILRFFTQMLLSLQHVHSKQILHRDLKTQNILLDKKREAVKIGDFGISKVLVSKSKAYTVGFR